ncbi:MAG: quercetin dioxygenase-like cupin family protein/DNA-binding XRE family transcriptional regulator [Burkholderiaceae bacterium]
MTTLRKRVLAMAPGTATPAATTLGLRLRHTRLVAGLTLLQLAQKASCSESLISKIERSLATPSLTMLHRLAVALETNIGILTSDDAPPDSPIIRHDARPVLKAGGIALERLVLPKRGGLLQANIHVVSPGEGSDGQIEHSGEEVGYVLEGTLELTLGESRYDLGPGDAFSFPSHVPHGYRNTGDVVARVLWVNSPATF